MCERSEHYDIHDTIDYYIASHPKAKQLRRPGNRNPKGKCWKAETKSEYKHKILCLSKHASDTKIELHDTIDYYIASHPKAKQYCADQGIVTQRAKAGRPRQNQNTNIRFYVCPNLR